MINHDFQLKYVIQQYRINLLTQYKYIIISQDIFFSLMTQQELSKQINMLKEYVQALERQNDSRNKQKDILLYEIQNLAKDNEFLRVQLEHANKSHYNAGQANEQKKSIQQLSLKIEVLSRNLQQSQKSNQIYQTQISALKNQRTRSQSSTFTMQKQQQYISQINKLKAENSELHKKSVGQHASSLQLEKLKKQNIDLKNSRNIQNNEKVNLLRLHQQQKQKQKQQIITVKSQMQKQFQRQKKLIEARFHQELENKQHTISQLSNKLKQMQNSIKNNDSQSYAEVRQLRIFKAEAQSKANYYQREKQSLLHKLKEIQLQLNSKNAMLAIRKQENVEVSRMKIQISKKTQELLQSTSIIEVLRENVTILENKVASLEKHIAESSNKVAQKQHSLQTQKLQQLKLSQAKYKSQIQEFKRKLIQSQKQISSISQDQVKLSAQMQRQNEQLKKIIKQLNENNIGLLNRIKSMQQFQQKYIQKSEDSHIKQVQQQKQKKEDLRGIVETLRNQLFEVKAEFRKFEGENKKMHEIINNKSLDFSDNQINRSHGIGLSRYKNESAQLLRYPRNMEQWHSNRSNNDLTINRVYDKLSQNDDQFKVRHTKLTSPNQKYKHNLSKITQSKAAKPIQKDKWQNLQRRIMQLREQNNSLKQSLSNS